MSSAHILYARAFANTPGGFDQSDICMTKVMFYLKLSQGHSPIDVSDSRLVATFTNERWHGEPYDTNGTIMTMTGVTGDGDSLLEVGEKYKVEIDFTEIPLTSVDPNPATRPDFYSHPYETFRIEIKTKRGLSPDHREGGPCGLRVRNVPRLIFPFFN